MRPKVLLATSCRWFAVARLAANLRNAGFLVELVCPGGHPVEKLTSVPRLHHYQGLFPIGSIKAAITSAEPALVIPCDDVVRIHLHSLYAREERRHGPGSSIAALLERSLGDPTGYPVVAARSRLIALAAAEGIRVPATAVIRDRREMRCWLSAHGLPAALKTDGTSGGIGVILVHTLEEADRAFAVLDAPPLLARVIKRALIDRDLNLVSPCVRRRRPLVNIQTVIQGYDATCTVACWQGKVVASLGFDVLHSSNAKGPSSVVKLNENLEMVSAAEKIASRLRLSGLYGFDFMIDEETGSSYLIEMNPRATQTCHLPLGPGRDLPAALWTVFSGEPAQETKSVTENKVVALFPNEWQRNPASSFLSTAYHDVPWEEPKLTRECVNRPAPGAWSFNAFAQNSSKLPWRR